MRGWVVEEYLFNYYLKMVLKMASSHGTGWPVMNWKNFPDIRFPVKEKRRKEEARKRCFSWGYNCTIRDCRRRWYTGSKLCAFFFQRKFLVLNSRAFFPLLMSLRIFVKSSYPCFLYILNSSNPGTTLAVLNLPT